MSAGPSTLSHQRGVLAARYADCLISDPRTLLFLLLQPPLIGWLCTLVWGSVGQDTPSLYFVMCLASVWFGCIGACREIVKERAIIERERIFGVGAWAVVLSKVQVLFVVSAIQALLLQFAVEWKLALHGAFVVQSLALVGASLCGCSLGLLVSATAENQERAVAAVPLLLLPQILFSEMAVPQEYFGSTVKTLEKLMPVRWAYRVFVESAAVEPSWTTVGLDLLVLWAIPPLLVGCAALALLPRREV